MPHDLMLKCQKNKLFKREGINVREWIDVDVSTLAGK